MRSRALLPSVILLLLGSAAARASEPVATAASAAGLPPPPAGMGSRQRLTDEDYGRKKENGYFTGLPLANSDPSAGIGFGARVYYFYNGTRGDPRFAYTPYLHRIFFQAFASTKGLQFHWIDYDAPNLGGTLNRLRAAAILARNTADNYYGRGARTMDDLSFTGAGRSYSTLDAYQAKLDEVGPDGKTRALYNKLDILRPVLLVSFERLVLGGLVRPFVGLGFSYNRVVDYTGKTSDAIDAATGDKVSAPNATTKLREDCDAGLVTGCDGGVENTFRLALAFDTRDFEPDPNSGVFAEVSSEFGSKILGSRFEYARLLGVVRGYVSPFPSLADVVLAGRLLYQVQSSGAPFFSMNVLPFSEDNRYGLGGVRTLRGYRQDRFVGPVMALANVELRWTALNTRAWGQTFAFLLVPFVDIGSVFDDVASTSLRRWRRGQGAGLRIAWNQATIAFIDYGFSSEDSGVYINFNHIF